MYRQQQHDGDAATYHVYPIINNILNNHHHSRGIAEHRGLMTIWHHHTQVHIMVRLRSYGYDKAELQLVNPLVSGFFPVCVCV